MAHPNLYERREFVKRLISENTFDRRIRLLTIEKFGCSRSAVDIDIKLAKGIKINTELNRIRDYIFERDEETYQYCSSTNSYLIVEHIIPKSKGGNNEYENLVAACQTCNSVKRYNIWAPKNFDSIWKTECHFNYVIENAIKDFRSIKYPPYSLEMYRYQRQK